VLRCQKVEHLPTAYNALKEEVNFRKPLYVANESTCWIPATCRVIYSTVTGSSTVRRWLWHSTLALSISTRPSAVRPWKNHRKLFQQIDGVGLTSERKTDVIIEHDNLSYCSGVLQLKNRLLFHAQNHDILPAHTHLTCVRQKEAHRGVATYSAGSLSHCLLGVFDLRGMRCALKDSI